MRTWIGAVSVALWVVGCSGSGSGGAVGIGGGAGTGTGGSGNAGTGGSGNAGTGGSGNAGTGGSGNAATGGSGGVSSTPACPGVDPIPTSLTPCRGVSDCRIEIEICVPAYNPSGCGACFPPERTCATDTDCGTDSVCVEVPNTAACACSGQPATECQAPCTATSCGDGERCRTDGHCEPTPCTAGFTCAVRTVCDATRAGADAHGCAPARCDTDGYACPDGFTCAAVTGADLHGCAPVGCEQGFTCPVNTECDASSTAPHHCARRACTSDAECDCGGCVFGTCQDRLYVCAPVPAP